MKSNTFIRRAERDDLDTIVTWMRDPDYLHFLYGDVVRSPRQIRENIATMLGRGQNNAMPASVHLVIDHKDHGLIGLASLQKISWRNRACTMEIYIGQKNLRGKIEGAVSLYRIAEYCFDYLNLHRITAYIYAFNAPSWRLLDRVGAVRELTLRDHVRRDGKLHDMYCYGLLRPEFDEFRHAEAQLSALSLEAMIGQLRIDGILSGSDS